MEFSPRTLARFHSGYDVVCYFLPEHRSQTLRTLATDKAAEGYDAVHFHHILLPDPIVIPRGDLTHIGLVDHLRDLLDFWVAEEGPRAA